MSAWVRPGRKPISSSPGTSAPGVKLGASRSSSCHTRKRSDERDRECRWWRWRINIIDLANEGNGSNTGRPSSEGRPEPQSKLADVGGVHIAVAVEIKGGIVGAEIYRYESEEIHRIDVPIAV